MEVLSLIPSGYLSQSARFNIVNVSLVMCISTEHLSDVISDEKMHVPCFPEFCIRLTFSEIHVY